MIKTKLRLAGLALFGALILQPAAANAQYYGGSRGGYGQAYRGEYGRGYDRRAYRGQGRYGGSGRSYRGRVHCDRGTGGTIIGAIAGGLLGNSVAGRGDRGVGTVVGAGVGALAGRAIDRDC